jgi:hypothetical protein
MTLRKLIPFIAAAAFLIPCAALDWPVAKRIVTGNFGESREDHFHAGIDIGGGEQDVHPIIDGELVFRYDENNDYTSVPRGVGTFVALMHADDILSIYCHMRIGSIPLDRTKFAASDVIGVVGDTGYSEGKHLHIEIYDGETDSFLNPLSILPPVPDHQPPIIKRILLQTQDRVIPLESGVSVPAGQGIVLAEIYDLREDVRFLWPMAPYRIRMAVNGKEISKITFDSLYVKDGVMAVGGSGVGVGALYAPERLIRCGTVELRGGESHLLLAAHDFAGNEAVKEIFLSTLE